MTAITRRPSITRRISTFFYHYPGLSLFLLLLPPLAWLLIVYIGSLAALLVQSFYTIDPMSMLVKEEFTLSTYEELFTAANIDVIKRTVYLAAAVTIGCAVLAFPLAYYMARYANRRIKGLLYLAVMLPLWSSYLVRVYAWRLILVKEGVINSVFEQLGLGSVVKWVIDRPYIGGTGTSLASTYLGMFLVFVYIWLPYMILPIHAALERVPKSLIDASSDLGARPGYTFRRVIFPLAFPGVVAGSIFTFSLTLGDYIVARVIGNSVFYIGPAVSSNLSFNIPLSAAFTVVSVMIMVIYLLIARRLGAFDAL